MDIGLFTQEGLMMVLRFIHFFAGIAWIGHLYYFNFVQGSFMAEVEAPVKNQAFSKLVPKALWWFRYGALFTFLSGTAMMTLVSQELGPDFYSTPYGIFIHTGGVLGTIMFLNVWLIIWPKQKILIANANTVIGGGAANPDAPKAASAALLASRTNVLFSIPLLFFMGASRHLNLTIPEGFSPTAVITAVTCVILLLELNAIKGKLGPMTTVKGVIHCGLALLVFMYVLIEIMV
jgi:uncharacterized membrane protein